MELSAAIAVVVAAIAPFITALFTNPAMSARTRRIIAGVVCLLLGVVVAVATGLIQEVPPDIVAWLGRVIVITAIVIGLAQGFYSQFKGSVDAVDEGSTAVLARRAK